jgi:ParB-like chromosome segregation protein Spo0J
MNPATMKTTSPPPDAPSPAQAELVPKYFDTDLIVGSPDNQVYTPEMVADLLPSVQERGFLVPGLVGPWPGLPTENHRRCHNGHRRLAVARILNLPFWAFDIGRVVDEAEQIELLFAHHQCQRAMNLAEIAERAARYIELKQCTDAVAAKALRVSPTTLCRAFGEKRILPELKSRTDLLTLSVRSLVAAAPAALMSQAVDFALTAREDGKKPTRDQVAAFIQQLKKSSGQPKGRKAKTVTLRLNGRVVTFTVDDRDSATSVGEDLKAIVAKLGKHADVPPDGWHFLFQ